MKQNWLKMYVLSILLAITLSNVGPASTVFTDFDLGKMSGLNREQLTQQLNRIGEDRESDQRMVINTLRNDSSDSNSKLAAIVIAGFYRMEKVARDLAKIIDFRDKSAPAVHRALPLWSEYPAEQAIIRIGDPAIPFLLKNLSSSDQKEFRQHSGEAMRIILGSGPAKCAIQDAILSHEYADNQEAKKRLENALALVEEPNSRH